MNWGDSILFIIPFLILIWSLYKYIKLVNPNCYIFNSRNENVNEENEENQEQQLEPDNLHRNRQSEVEVIRIIIVENPNKFFKNDSTETCPICLETMEIGRSNSLASMSCEHTFHKDCIIEWLRHSNMCPICRK